MELKLDKLVKYEKRENSKLLGRAKVLIDGCFLIEDIRILEGVNGLRLAMPSRKLSNGEHVDVAHPINEKTRAMFEELIFSEFNKED